MLNMLPWSDAVTSTQFLFNKHITWMEKFLTLYKTAEGYIGQ